MTKRNHEYTIVHVIMFLLYFVFKMRIAILQKNYVGDTTKEMNNQIKNK